MNILITARNILNGEEVQSWIDSTFTDRYPALTSWNNSVLRKWIMKTAPAETAVVPTANLPAWLRDSMANGIVPESVILDAALETRVQFVMDFLNASVAQNPDANLAAIGFEVAEAKSKKWHERLAKKAQDAEPVQAIDEVGTKTVIAYPDGWTWRNVISRAAMDREGSVMGHCVGTHGYYEASLRGHNAIYSLRDAKNEPHVTIEVNEKLARVKQIRGKGNAAVIPEYQQRVADYLKSRTWSTVNFDGLASIMTQVRDHQAKTAPAYYEHDVCRATVVLGHHGYGSDTKTSLQVSKIGTDTVDATELNLYQNGTVLNIAAAPESWAVPLLRKMCVDKKLRLEDPIYQLGYLLLGTNWTNNGLGWCAPGNSAAQDLINVFAGEPAVGGQILLGPNDNLRGFYLPDAGGTIYFLVSMTKYARDSAVQLKQPVASVKYSQDFVQNTWGEDLELAREVQRLHLGRGVVTDASDTELLNSLMLALKQPDTASVKELYNTLRVRDSVTDQNFKSAGFSTSGRAVNAIGTVLVCSLAIKNSAMFRDYVFNKPNTLNCWLEVMTAPNHLTASLLSYGLATEQLETIMELLRNEFARLVPTPAELQALDLDSTVHQRVQKAMAWAKAHKPNVARSKAIWAFL